MTTSAKKAKKVNEQEEEIIEEIVQEIAEEEKTEVPEEEKTEVPEEEKTEVPEEIKQEAKIEVAKESYKIESQLETDIEKAKEAQKRRLETPKVDMFSVQEIARKKEIERYVPEAVGKDASLHAMYGDKLKHAEYISQGYEPVTYRGRQVISEGDPLYTIPKALHDRHVEEASLRSKRMLIDGSESAIKAGEGMIEEEIKVH